MGLPTYLLTVHHLFEKMWSHFVWVRFDNAFTFYFIQKSLNAPPSHSHRPNAGDLRLKRNLTISSCEI